MDSKEPKIISEENNQSTSTDEPSRTSFANKRFLPIVVLVGIIVMIVIIAGLVSVKTAKDKSITIQPSNIPTPTQIVEIKTVNPPSEFETEATSITVEDVDANFSDIDKDLKELN